MTDYDYGNPNDRRERYSEIRMGLVQVDGSLRAPWERWAPPDSGDPADLIVRDVPGGAVRSHQLRVELHPECEADNCTAPSVDARIVDEADRSYLHGWRAACPDHLAAFEASRR